jgi:hypothetical protein
VLSPLELFDPLVVELFWELVWELVCEPAGGLDDEPADEFAGEESAAE